MDVLDLKAKISLDQSEYDKGLDDASGKASGFGSKLASGIGGAVKTVAKVGAAAVGAASAAVVGLTKQAVESFADYEQLVGGVETLFGDSADFVVRRAKNAFETAGLSANDYMETVTSFSASLLQSLGGDTDAAARVADQAIIDMSDNANKMGSSMESIQNAYQGFAKQNYTMLDNLKLGYGGTKEEMERLLSDAGKLANTEFDISSYADVIEAIHVIQENMGIAGTTAEEAATTISGSLSMVKSAWSNVLTAIGGGDMTDISESIGDLVYSAKTFGENVIPVVQRSMEGIVQLIQELAPEIAAVIPTLVSDLLPQIVSAGVEILGALGQALTDNVGTILDAAGQVIDLLLNAMLDATSNGGGQMTSIIQTILSFFTEKLPQMIEVGAQIIANVAQGISEALPTIIPLAVDLIMQVVDAIIQNIPLLLDAANQLVLGLADGILTALPLLIERIPELVQSLVDAIVAGLPILIDGTIQLVMGLVAALPQIIEAIVEAIPQIITSVIEGILSCLPQLIAGVVELILGLVANLPTIIVSLVEAIPEIVVSIIEAIIACAPMFVDAVSQIGQAIREMIATSGAGYVQQIGETMSNVLTTAVTWLQQLPERAAYFAGEMVGQFIMFIINLPNKITEIFNNVVTSLKTFGTKFITEGPRIASEFGQKLINGLQSLPSKMLEIGRNIVDGLKNGIVNAWDNMTGVVWDLVQSFIAGLKDYLKIGSPSKVMADEIGQWIPAGIAVGIEDNMKSLDDAIDGMYRDITTPAASFGGITTSNDTESGGGFAQVISLLQQIRDGGNVTVVLEGDADRLFRVMQSKATSNYRLTGNAGLVTI